MDSHVSSNRNESWTDEKHVNFLNSMEAWFVHTMLENKDRYNLRLDRHLPDSSDFIGKTRSKMKGRPNKSSRRPSQQPQDSLHDQVVPQIGNRTGDKDEEDLTNAPIASMAPEN
ncbi:hypothetical protein CRYUN_Cryun07bG0099500 [Craigia yunnanensis]